MANRVIKNKNTEFITSLLTQKGDLLTRNVSQVVKLPVGTDGFVLTADSTQAEGIKWSAGGGGGGTWMAPEIFTANAGIVATNQITLTSTPLANSELVYLNGSFASLGAGEDYTLSGAVITFVPAITLVIGDKITVKYQT